MSAPIPEVAQSGISANTRGSAAAPEAVPDPSRHLSELGYTGLCERGPAGLCGVKAMLYTGAIVTGLTVDGYSGRYCYPTIEEAAAALALWDGRRDPPGAWIKYKSCTVERLGPGAET